MNSDKTLFEFCKVIGEFIPDLLTTFPEYKENLDDGIIQALEYANLIKNNPMNDISGNQIEIDSKLDENANVVGLLDHCKAKFPEFFFDILYQNEDMFNDKNDTEFLPNITFSDIWKENITDKTKEVIWKYLQLLLLTIMPEINDESSFGDTAKLFEAIDETEFKDKLEETISSMQGMFDTSNNPLNMDTSDISNNLPNPDDLHNHINSMLGGKLGKLAQEITEETAKDLDIDLEDTGDVSDVNGLFKKLFKNPGKLMNIVKNIGGKIDNKIKSGEISQDELMKEASSMLKNMDKMPGMGNIKSMLQKFGMPKGKGSNINMNAFQAHMSQNIKSNKQRERMLEKLENNKKARENREVKVFTSGEAPERSTKKDKPNKKNNKKGKRRKNKNKK
tara:strand:+ start:39454 stop:40629 length:1176 start_codon:yes stop_codon:yes gene_type:complete